jgi:hypothetical protein
MIKLDQPAADYVIRVATVGLNQVATGIATLSYTGSSGPATPNPVINYAGQNLTADFTPFSDAAIVPFEQKSTRPSFWRSRTKAQSTSGHYPAWKATA